MLRIRPIPAFEDNYIWLLQVDGSSAAAVVDPGDEAPVLEVLRQEGLTLSAILATHRHGDHVGGVLALHHAYPEALVFGPQGGHIAGVNRPVQDRDSIELPGLGVSLQAWATPGHTEEHLSFYYQEGHYGGGALFCGDTLFTCGCGRVFTGTHEQLFDSLQRIAGLPEATRVYCAHEYTTDNIGFAKWVEPDNEALLRRELDTAAARSRGDPTVPSTLGLELATNPFLRTGVAEVIAAAERWVGHPLEHGRDVFRALRTWKDKEYD
jgi:hydroxyacylglutathione hydrolase